MTRRLPLAALAVVASGAALAGCEVPLAPVDRGGRVFSMSGYLDTEADTHWVRVEPLGVTIDPVPGPIDARVVLEGPGGETPFVQEVVAFQTGPAHLFWVVADLDPGETYTVVATDAEGAAARARVQMPPPHEPPVLVDGPTACPVTLTYGGPEPVVDAFVTYRTYPVDGPPSLPAQTARFSRRRQILRSGGSVQATVYFGSDAVELGLDPSSVIDAVRSAEIALAVGTPAWPAEADLETALIPTDNPDIENGVGFVGGATVWRRTFQPGLSVIPFGPTGPCYEAGREPR